MKIEFGMCGCIKCGDPYPDPYCKELGSRMCATCNVIGHPTAEIKTLLRPFMQRRDMKWKQLISQMRRYRLHFDELASMVRKQGDHCGKCGQYMTIPCIDHDHACCDTLPTCGLCTRGMICPACNTLMAGYDHYVTNPEEVERYLESYRNTRENKISNSERI